MGSKHDILTEEEVVAYEVRPRTLATLADAASRLGRSSGALRVLDWGCGRGTTVAKLLELGYDAYGVDIDSEPIEKGARLFTQRGENPGKRLVQIGPDNRTSFPSGFFHVILSDQVFEHVSDLDGVVGEMARIAAPHGVGLHVFPAKWRVIEPHLFLPCVHWLPKNRLRYAYLRLMLKRVPTWEETELKSASERAQIYYDYSIQKTYYRSCKYITATLGRHGFAAKYCSDSTAWSGMRLRRYIPPRGLSSEYSQRLWIWWSNTLREVVLSATRV